jgi:hypothetical protein
MKSIHIDSDSGCIILFQVLHQDDASQEVIFFDNDDLGGLDYIQFIKNQILEAA